MTSGKTGEPAGGRDFRVMVISDGQASTTELVSFLEKEGIVTTTMPRQEWCAKSLDHNSPSVVIIAAGVGSEGWEISSRIRHDSDVPIIVAGVAGDQMAWVKAAEYGVDYYLPKPVSPRELVARIRALIRRHRPSLCSTAGDTNGRGDS